MGQGMSEYAELIFPFLSSSNVTAGSRVFRDHSEISEINA